MDALAILKKPESRALPSTGPLKMSQIQSEFGGSNPISLTEYYGAASGVPASGAISINDFRGKSNVITLTSWGAWATGTGDWSANLSTPPGTSGNAARLSGLNFYFQTASTSEQSWSGTATATYTIRNVFRDLPDLSPADAGKRLRGPATHSQAISGGLSNPVRSVISGPVSSTLQNDGTTARNVTIAWSISAANNGTLTATMTNAPTKPYTHYPTTHQFTLNGDPTKFTVS
jgi:hypothetical protein